MCCAHLISRHGDGRCQFEVVKLIIAYNIIVVALLVISGPSYGFYEFLEVIEHNGLIVS